MPTASVKLSQPQNSLCPKHRIPKYFGCALWRDFTSFAYPCNHCSCSQVVLA